MKRFALVLFAAGLAAGVAAQPAHADTYQPVFTCTANCHFLVTGSDVTFPSASAPNITVNSAFVFSGNTSSTSTGTPPTYFGSLGPDLVTDSYTWTLMDDIDFYAFTIADATDGEFTSYVSFQSGLGAFDGTESGTLRFEDLTPPSAVPEPGSLALVGTGLLGCVGAVRRRMR